MNISIVSTNYYMSGTYVNFLDLYDALNKKYDVTLYYTQLDKNGFWLPHMIKQTGRNYKLEKHLKLYGNVWVKDDIVITDFRGLVICHHWQIPIVCSKLIIMDSVELSYHLNNTDKAKHWFDFDFSYNESIYTYLVNNQYDEITFLMPKVNIEKFKLKYPLLASKEYYKKINYDVLSTANISDNGKFCYRVDEGGLVYNILEKADEFDNLDLQYKYSVFDYKGFLFRRRKRLRYWEQFGRLIFEYIMVGKTVQFLSEPFEIDDGLTNYLKFYKIKFDERKNIITGKDELINKVYSQKEDELLWM